MSICYLKEINKTKRDGVMNVKVEQMMLQGSCQKLLMGQVR